MGIRKRNHHFVPKFYLRNFSENCNEKTIGVWLLEQSRMIRGAAIRHQGSADDFYGKDEIVEDALMNLENIVAPYIRMIILMERIPQPGSDAFVHLLVFFTSLCGRTEHASEEINEVSDKMWKNIFEKDERVSEEAKKELKNLRIEMVDAPRLSVYQTMLCAPILSDLKWKLLINRTEIPFVTSDNPVVLYNQFLEARRWRGGHTGFAIKGLQLFLPLSPLHTLVLYDSRIYKIGGKKEKEVEYLDKRNDVEQLNTLQFLNANRVLFCSNEALEEDFFSLSRKFLHKRAPQKAVVEEWECLDVEEGKKATVLATHSSNLRMGLQLSILKMRKGARDVSMGPTMANVRDEELLAYHEKKAKELMDEHDRLNGIKPSQSEERKHGPMVMLRKILSK